MGWWENLSEQDRRAYLQEHPGSAHVAGDLRTTDGAPNDDSRRTAQDIHRYLGRHAVVTHRNNGDVHVRSAVAHPRMNKALFDELAYHGVRGQYNRGNSADPGMLIHHDLARDYGRKGLRFPGDPEVACDPAWDELARDQGWFDRLSRKEQRDYLRAHPGSKFVPSARSKPATRAAKKPVAKRPAVEKNTAPKTVPPSRPSTTPETFETGTIRSDYPEDASEAWNRTMASDPEEFVQALLRGTGLRSDTSVNSTRKNGVEITMDAGAFDAKRTFDRDGFGNLVAHHDSFAIKDDDRQGHGIAKTFLRNSMAEYQRMGVHRVDMVANIDVGGYAWARYGFAPDHVEWRGLRSRMENRLSVMKQRMPKHAYDEVKKLLKSDDPRTVWKIADMSVPSPAGLGGKPATVGKLMLLGSKWHGHLKLGDKDAMARFHAYVGKK